MHNVVEEDIVALVYECKALLTDQSYVTVCNLALTYRRIMKQRVGDRRRQTRYHRLLWTRYMHRLRDVLCKIDHERKRVHLSEFDANSV